MPSCLLCYSLVLQRRVVAEVCLVSQLVHHSVAML